MQRTTVLLVVLFVCLLALLQANGLQLSVSSSLRSKHRVSNALDACFKLKGSDSSCKPWGAPHDFTAKPLDLLTIGGDRMCRLVQLAAELPPTDKLKRCGKVEGGEYDGKCCCQAMLTKIHFFCESVHKDPKNFKALTSPVDWVAAWPVRSDYSQKESLESHDLTKPISKIPNHAPLKDSEVQALLKPQTDALTHSIALEAQMTEYPASDEADVIIYRLNEIEKDHKKIHSDKYEPVLHQIELLRELMDKPKPPIRSREFLRAVSVCVANLHAAVRILKFLAIDKQQLVPEYSSVGDHFFANALIGQDYFNAYKFNPYQIKGLQDPMVAVDYVMKYGPKLDEDTQKLLTKTLALDMSSWARLQTKPMRVNGDLSDDNASKVYDVIMEFIDNNWSTYKSEGFAKKFPSAKTRNDDFRYTKLTSLVV